MSDVVGIEKITDRAGTGAPDFTNGFNINGSDSGISTFKHTESANEPSSPSNGDAWLDTDNNIYKVYINGEWKDWLGTSAPATTYFGDRAHWASGGRAHPSPGGNTTQIDYWDITSLGNAADFGDCAGSPSGDCASDGTKIYYLGGGATTTQIEFWTSATLGNSADFGDTATAAGQNIRAASSNGSKCLYVPEQTGGSYSTNIIEQFPTGTAGITATDFGDLTLSRWIGGTVNSSSRFVYGGGQNSSYAVQNVMDYVAFDTAGNATDFGDLSVSRSFCAGIGSNETTRGLFAGGYSGSAALDTIDYITIATAGNATDHGNLLQTTYGAKGCANASRAVIAGGIPADGSRINTIQYTALTTAANSVDFGDLSLVKYGGGSASGAAS